MTSTGISIERLKKIIREELSVSLTEDVDHEGIKNAVTGASKLLSAVQAFKQSAPPSALNAVTPHINQLQRVLEDMLSNPGGYVAQPKVEPKKVSLRAVKGESKK